MVFKLKNKVGYPVLGLMAFTFLVLLPLNVITLFSDEAVNLGASTTFAGPADGHLVLYNGHWYCECGPPYNCWGCQPRPVRAHWEKIGGRWICMCGGPGYECSPCYTRAIK